MLKDKVNLRKENPDIFFESFVHEDEVRNALVIFPGGAYHVCAPHEATPIAEEFYNKGFNCFVVYYSLNENAAYPNPVTDAAKAIKIIRANAEKYKIKKDAIAVLGFSAGGHLAASISTLFNEDDVLKPISAAPSEVKPNAAVLCYPVTSSAFWMFHKSIGDNICGNKDKQYVISKINTFDNVTKNTPPTYIWSTFSDDCVPIEDSLCYMEALAKADVPFESHIFSHGRHGLGLAKEFPDISRWTDEAADFLQRIFSGETNEPRAKHK